MASIGEILKVGADGSIQVQLNKSINHVRKVSDYLPYGEDTLPEVGDKVFLVSLDNQNNKIMLGVRRKDAQRIAKEGEKRIFSKTGAQVYLTEDDDIIIETAGGAKVTCKANGNIELNGNTKSAMLWEDFNTVWTAFMTHYKAHTHTAISVGSPTSTIIIPITGTEENMSPAQSAKTKLGAND